MATKLVKTIMLTGPLRIFGICCFGSDDEDGAIRRPLIDDRGRLLDRSGRLARASDRMAAYRERLENIYGRKKAPGTAAANAIFGTPSSPRQVPSSSVRRPAVRRGRQGRRGRDPLSDLTPRFANFNLQIEDDGIPASDTTSSDSTSLAGSDFFVDLRAFHPGHPEVREEDDADDEDGGDDDENEDNDQAERSPANSVPSLELASPQLEIPQGNSVGSIILSSDDLAVLKPLLDAYTADRNQTIPIVRWDSVLTPGARVDKIAEASYAEVYRVTIDEQTSIIKVMQLKIPSDAASADLYTAIDVHQVVSEVRLMNALTEYPGFVTFKEAHLIQGRPCNSIIRAYQGCDKWNPSAGLSEFPHPNSFNKNSLFLVIELGDAGTVLDDIQLNTIQEVWDVLLDLIIALAQAEHYLEFEHRDVHENNLCIAFGEVTAVAPSTERQKYGSSGLRMTLLDYGLSRATLENGDEVFFDLEQDLGVFRGTAGHPQYDTYRRMRTHLFTGTRTIKPRPWHGDESRHENDGHTWQEHTPYSNVLWIKYIYGYLTRDFRASPDSAPAMAQFREDTKEFCRRLNFNTLPANGAFASALEILQFVLEEEKWITEEEIQARVEESVALGNEE